MRRLMLLRHAKTENDAPSGRDQDRRLDKRGRSDAAEIGAWIGRHPPFPESVLVSPANRAHQTWEIAWEAMEDLVPEPRVELVPELYGADPAHLLQIIREVSAADPQRLMLAEYVPADFDAQQRQTSEEALGIVARESGIDAARISSAVRQGGIYHEILEEAAAIKADLIVMTSHRPAMRTYFLGSNAGHVVRYAKCSVLVVRH